MKAIIIKSKNKPFILSDIEPPKPGRGEALVQLKAAAFNHRDLWIRKGLYAGLKYPVTPGSDGSGIVVSVGDKTQTAWLGKEVIINPCFFWGDEQTCQSKDFQILGMPGQGTFAEFICVPEELLYEKPAHLSFEQAAALPLAGLTAFRALFRRAFLKAGERLLVSGIGGGVAQFALQFGLRKEAEVYVSSGSDEKIEKAIQLGALGGANYKQDNWAEKLKKDAKNFDVIIDGAAGESMSQFMDLAAPGARIVIYGGTRGKMEGLSPQVIFWKQLSILGTTMGSPDDFRAMLKFVNTHHLVPQIDEVYPFSEAEAASVKMEQGDQFGKLVLAIS